MVLRDCIAVLQPQKSHLYPSMTDFFHHNQSRRSFLRVGGALLAIPFLETLASAAQAKVTPPKRVIFLGGGFGFTKDTFYPD